MNLISCQTDSLPLGRPEQPLYLSKAIKNNRRRGWVVPSVYVFKDIFNLRLFISMVPNHIPTWHHLGSQITFEIAKAIGFAQGNLSTVTTARALQSRASLFGTEILDTCFLGSHLALKFSLSGNIGHWIRNMTSLDKRDINFWINRILIYQKKSFESHKLFLFIALQKVSKGWDSSHQQHQTTSIMPLYFGSYSWLILSNHSISFPGIAFFDSGSSFSGVTKSMAEREKD